jgi:ornithine cyclodeaminase/alanine dehydrogenase-like protein (mu-crystallin family)
MAAADHSGLLYLDSATVAELCETLDPVGVVTAAFHAVRAGRAGVAEEAALRWTASDGTAARSLVLPAHHAGAYGCKIINASLGNVDRGLPRASGLIMLFDQDTAAPVCLMEGARISALRTAAVSVAALGAIRSEAVTSVAFLGGGRQARTHLELLSARGRLVEVTVYDVDPLRGREFAKHAAELLPAAAIEVAETARAAMRSAHVTIAATTTTVPYVDVDWLPEGAVFVNVSLDDAAENLLLECDHLFVDDWHLVSDDDTRLLGRLATAGLVTGPGEPAPPGGRAVDADIATLLAGAGPRPIATSDRVVVNPFGMGVHDIALAAQVHAGARNRDAGIWLTR